MNEEKRKEIEQNAKKFWDEEEWQNQLIEEIGEYLASTNHFKRGRCTVFDVFSEMVDIEINLEYFKRLSREKIGDFWQEEKDRKYLKMQEKILQGKK